MSKQYPSQWYETSSGVYFVVAEAVQFYDDFDHWRNGFCRLLAIEPEEAKRFIELSVLESEPLFSLLTLAQKTEAIKKAVKTHFKAPPKHSGISFVECGTTFNGMTADALCATSIGGDASRLIVGNGRLQYAWQVDAASYQRIKPEPIEEFDSGAETPEVPNVGLREYASNSDWRMEKSRRLIKTILSKHSTSSLETRAKLLDVGSGAGYIRKAAAEFQLDQFGLESSERAIQICHMKFGFDSLKGSIENLLELAPELVSDCEYITLFDLIERLEDPISAITTLKQFLSYNGCIVIRTPNLVSLEYDILGDYYYSFKPAHLHYFSPNSLNKLMNLCGFRQTYLETTSHLFKGLLGLDFIHQCGKGNIGADILAIYVPDA